MQRGDGGGHDGEETDLAHARTEPATVIDSLSGQTFDHYRVGAELGRGGMGVVYRAVDLQLGREVALKVLPASLAGDDERRARLLREARSAAAVDHPNVATVYQVGQAHGRVFLAMELVQGGTLRVRLERGPLDTAEATRIARHIVAGLARAHEKGIVHRDLKPENVMLSPDGGVKILDFGLAKLLLDPPSTPTAIGDQATQTQEGRVMGTPGYMAPEQASGLPVDARTDVYAFGVVLYEMQTGELPGPFSSRKSASGGLDAILLRCLAYAAEDRWRDAGEVLRALDGLAPAPRSATPARRAPRWVLLALSALCAGALAAGAVAASRGARPVVAPPAPPATAAPRATTVTDLPPPPTAVPEARSEYAAGMQLVRDNSYAPALAHFERAVELDPSMAMAHLRIAILSSSADTSEFARAMALRSQLGDRDLAFVQALEPVYGRNHKDYAESVRRLEAAQVPYPADAELADFLATFTEGTPARSVPAARKAIELDPRNGGAWEILARSVALTGDLEASRRALEQCAAPPVNSSDCLGTLAALSAEQGRCADMEHEYQRQADQDPSASFYLADAMLAQGRSRAAAREVLDRWVSGRDAATASRFRVRFGAELSALDGRFDLASKQLDDLAGLLAGAPSARWRLATNRILAFARVDLALETGDEAGARAAAAMLLDRLDSLTGVDQDVNRSDGVPWRLVRLAGRPLEPGRAAWLDEQSSMFQAGSVLWTQGWASGVRTPAEGSQAMAALARDPRLAVPNGGEFVLLPMADADAGRALLLGGDATRALPLLRRAASNCWVLTHAYERVHATLDLGAALEQAGDAAGACEAYSKVVSTWGEARPRSVSADTARAALRRLRCAR